MMEHKTFLPKYFWQVMYVHTIAYIIARIFEIRVMYVYKFYSLFYASLHYPEYAWCGSPIIINYEIYTMSWPIVVFLSYFLIFGIIKIISLMKLFFEKKYDLIKLGIIIFGLLILLSVIEGVFFARDWPYWLYLILNCPEAILYALMFIGTIKLLKNISKKIIAIILLPIAVFLLIVLIIGYNKILDINII